MPPFSPEAPISLSDEEIFDEVPCVFAPLGGRKVVPAESAGVINGLIPNGESLSVKGLLRF